MMMEYLRETVSDDTELVFVESGGTPGRPLTRLFHFVLACVAATRRSSGPSVNHVNVSAHGSALRKVVLTSVLLACKKPYIVHLHSGGFPNYLSQSHPFVRFFVRRMFQRASKIVVLGTVWREWVLRNMDVSPLNIRLVPNAVPGSAIMRETTMGNDPITFLFAGRLEPAKGVPELLEAWSSIRPGSVAKLILAGSVDPKYEDLGRCIKMLEGQGVEAVGWVSRDVLVGLYQEADVVILPSHYENLPLVVLEGMSHGLVPIATDVGAVCDVIDDGVNGIIVPVRDSQALASAMTSLIENPTHIRCMSSAAYWTWHEKFNLNTYRERLDGIYLEVSIEGSR